jgi:hypothetical protein
MKIRSNLACRDQRHIPGLCRPRIVADIAVAMRDNIAYAYI